MATHRQNANTGSTPQGMWRRDQSMRSTERSEWSPRQSSAMEWRAAGAQFYPGGAYEELQQISHRGRGPKGYRRSDELLKEIICEKLTDDPFIDARNVTVEVDDCEVTLRGTVEERPQKYAIEDLVADVTGVSEVHNLLGVSNGPERSG